MYITKNGKTSINSEYRLLTVVVLIVNGSAGDPSSLIRYSMCDPVAVTLPTKPGDIEY